MIDLKHSRNLVVRPRADSFHVLFLLPVLMMAGFGLIMLTNQVTAQTFTVLHSFTAAPPYPFNTNSDGVGPNGLILSGNTLYGTAAYGGSSGNGAVFAVKTDGTGFTTLHSFAADRVDSSRNFTNSDGKGPDRGLILSSNALYGTAAYGGSSAGGTVFKVNTDGTGFTNLHTFAFIPYYTNGDGQEFSTNSDGAAPFGGLILANNTLYGTTDIGGSSGNGTLFKVSTEGTGFATLHSFSALDTATFTTNSDGAHPYAGLTLSSNTLYGTAFYGGSSGFGTVLKVNADGTGFTVLHSFTNGNESAGPASGVVLSGNTLYGTTAFGGSSSGGTVFKVKTDGTGFTILHNFDDGSDGTEPNGLVLSGNTLYGTTPYSGNADVTTGPGTVFAVKTDGTGFMTLHRLTDGGDGSNPSAGVILSGDTLYGTASSGWDGILGGGTVFSLSFPPQLTIISCGTNVALIWPTNYAGFDYTGYKLQSNPNLGSAVWSTNSPSTVVVNGKNTVTNLISGTQQFFRLIK